MVSLKICKSLCLRNEKPITVRPGELLEAEDFDAIAQMLQDKHGIQATKSDVISSALYPKVFDDYLKYVAEHGDLSRMGSDVYFHGLEEGETCEVDIDEGQDACHQAA